MGHRRRACALHSTNALDHERCQKQLVYRSLREGSAWHVMRHRRRACASHSTDALHRQGCQSEAMCRSLLQHSVFPFCWVLEIMTAEIELN